MLNITQEIIEPIMVQLPSGTFMMGSDDMDADTLSSEKSLHPVYINSFEIGKYPITQREWEAIMGNNPSYFKGDENRPVENINWFDTQEYIQKLNQLTGKNYRLPSEAEWEYACKAGMQYQYSGSDDVHLVAWHEENSNGTTHPVGQKQANAWGLYDMSGNVWEWVQDWFHENYNGAPTDGRAWETDMTHEARVLRGGSWIDFASYTRAAYRSYFSPSLRRGDYRGFRVARSFL